MAGMGGIHPSRCPFLTLPRAQPRALILRRHQSSSPWGAGATAEPCSVAEAVNANLRSFPNDLPARRKREAQPSGPTKRGDGSQAEGRKTGLGQPGVEKKGNTAHTCWDGPLTRSPLEERVQEEVVLSTQPRVEGASDRGAATVHALTQQGEALEGGGSCHQVGRDLVDQLPGAARPRPYSSLQEQAPQGSPSARGWVKGDQWDNPRGP